SADCRWCRYAIDAEGLRFKPEAANVDRRAGPDDCVRQHREPAAGARNGTEGGDEPADSTGCDARADCAATADGECIAGGDQRNGGTDCVLRRCEVAAGAGVSRRAACAYQCEPVNGSAGVCDWCVDADGCAVWRSAGIDECEGCTGGCAAGRRTNDDGWCRAAAAWVSGDAGSAFCRTAGCCGAFFAKPGQAAAYGHEAGVEEPLYRPFLRTDGGL